MREITIAEFERMTKSHPRMPYSIAEEYFIKGGLMREISLSAFERMTHSYPRMPYSTSEEYFIEGGLN